MPRKSEVPEYVPDELARHAHVSLEWQPYADIPWRLFVAVTKTRRGTANSRCKTAAGYFVAWRHHPEIIGCIALNQPDLTLSIVAHEVTHAMCHYVRLMRRRRVGIPKDIRRVEPCRRFQSEEVLAYGVGQSADLLRELRELVRSARRKISEK